MNDRKEQKVSVRLDSTSYEKLNHIMRARDVSQSDAVRLCINGARILQIGDAKNLATEFCRIRKALDNNGFDEDVKKGVNMLCRSIKELLLQTEESIESEIE